MSFYMDTTRKDNPLDSNLSNDSGTPGTTTETTETPAFLTQQSLTYSGAIAAIGIVWALAQNAMPGPITQGPWVPVIASALLIFSGLAGTWADLKDVGKKIQAVLIATFNSAMLTAGALGITALAQTAIK